MLISEIANLLGYEMVGEDCEINGISWFDSAKENDIAVIKRKKELFHTSANVVLTKPIIVQTDKTLLITYEDIEYSAVKVCEALINLGILPDYSAPVKYVKNEREFYIGENCIISDRAVIQPGVMIGDNVVISEDCYLEPYVVIGSGTILEKGIHIGAGSRVGTPSFYHYYVNGQIRQFKGCGIVRIGRNTTIGCNTTIQRGTFSDTVIGENTMIGNSIDIGHDVKIGNNCKIVSQTGFAGNACVKDNVTIYGQVGVTNNVVVGNNAIIKAQSLVSKSVNDNEIIFGPFGRKYSEEMKITAKVRKFFERKED